MTRFRYVLGAFTGFLLMLSAAAHSLLGWPVQRAALGMHNVPAEVVTGLGMGWNFAGAAMLAFGVIVTHAFTGRLRGTPHSLFAPRVAALLWIVFGLGAYALSRMGFFLAVFTLPGVLLAIASFGREDAGRE
jgi:hypothetical protein